MFIFFYRSKKIEIMRSEVLCNDNHYESVLTFLNDHSLEEKFSDITFICRLV